MISKGYLYHLVQVKDSYSENSTLQSVLVVFEFPEIFPEDLPSVPPEKGIDFYLYPSEYPAYSIPPYRMALAEFKKFKEQLKDLGKSSDLVFHHGVHQYFS